MLFTISEIIVFSIGGKIRNQIAVVLHGRVEDAQQAPRDLVHRPVGARQGPTIDDDGAFMVEVLGDVTAALGCLSRRFVTHAGNTAKETKNTITMIMAVGFWQSCLTPSWRRSSSHL